MPTNTQILTREMLHHLSEDYPNIIANTAADFGVDSQAFLDAVEAGKIIIILGDGTISYFGESL